MIRRRDNRNRRIDLAYEAWWPGDLKVTAKAVSGSTLIEPQPGFFYCNGALASRTQYERLYNEIGLAYNIGSGGEDGTNFRLPDYRGRSFLFPLDGATGANRVLSAGARGAVGGTETETLSIANMAPHDHGGVTGQNSVNHTHTDSGHGHAVNDPSHRHAVGTLGNGSASDDDTVKGHGAAYFTAFAFTGITINSGVANIGINSVNHTHTIPSQGGGVGHNNVSPHQVAGAVLIRY